jgi:hypothetical protein
MTLEFYPLTACTKELVDELWPLYKRCAPCLAPGVGGKQPRGARGAYRSGPPQPLAALPRALPPTAPASATGASRRRRRTSGTSTSRRPTCASCSCGCALGAQRFALARRPATRVQPVLEGMAWMRRHARTRSPPDPSPPPPLAPKPTPAPAGQGDGAAGHVHHGRARAGHADCDVGRHRLLQRQGAALRDVLQHGVRVRAHRHPGSSPGGGGGRAAVFWRRGPPRRGARFLRTPRARPPRCSPSLSPVPPPALLPPPRTPR